MLGDVLMHLRLLNQGREELRAYVHGRGILQTQDGNGRFISPTMSEFTLAKMPLSSFRIDPSTREMHARGRSMIVTLKGGGKRDDSLPVHAKSASERKMFAGSLL